MNRVEERTGFLVEALHATPPDLRVSGADVNQLGLVGGGHPEDLLDIFGQLAETLLAGIQIGLDPFALDSDCQNSCRRLEKMDLVLAKLARLVAMDCQDPVRLFLSSDNRADAAAKMVVIKNGK